MIVGIIGLMASGKGTLAKAFEKRGFTRFTYSDLLREELRNRGNEITRKNLQDLGDELRKAYGAGYLTKKFGEGMEKGKNYVLEGIRNPAEIEELREHAIKNDEKCLVLSIEAPLERRFQWIMIRSRENDFSTLQALKAYDERDRGKGEPDDGLQIDKCFALADMKIMNDKTPEHLQKQIDKLLKKLKIA